MLDDPPNPGFSLSIWPPLLVPPPCPARGMGLRLSLGPQFRFNWPLFVVIGPEAHSRTPPPQATLTGPKMGPGVDLFICYFIELCHPIARALRFGEHTLHFGERARWSLKPLKNPSKKWGASPPTFLKDFPAARGRRPDPPNPGFSLSIWPPLLVPPPCPARDMGLKLSLRPPCLDQATADLP